MEALLIHESCMICWMIQVQIETVVERIHWISNIVNLLWSLQVCKFSLNILACFLVYTACSVWPNVCRILVTPLWIVLDNISTDICIRTNILTFVDILLWIVVWIYSISITLLRESFCICLPLILWHLIFFFRLRQTILI